MRIRKIKKLRTKNKFSFPKIKTVFLVHLRFTSMQLAIGLIMFYFLKTERSGPLPFIMLSLIICGIYGFPMWATRAINRVVRQNEYTGIWGNLLFQTSVCFSIIRLIVPLEQSYLWVNTCAIAFVLSIVLLLFSIKRSPRKLFSNLAK